MSSPASHRLFFALWPDDEQRAALVSVIQSLGPVPAGRPVPAGNLHVTLAFLGNVAPERVPLLREAARARVWPGDALVFDRLAWWPKARLLCLEASALPSAFVASVTAFHEDLRQGGFSIERRPFRAHITLARGVSRVPGDDARPRPVPPFTWPVQGLALVTSMPTPEGSVYRVLEQF